MFRLTLTDTLSFLCQNLLLYPEGDSESSTIGMTMEQVEKESECCNGWIWCVYV